MSLENNTPTHAWLDFSDEDIPQIQEICVACNEGNAIPFDIKSPDNPSELHIDQRMGLDQSTTTLQWVLDRQYATPDIAKYLPPNVVERDFRDLFFERVFTELSKICSEQKLAEIYAYLGTEQFEFTCVDDYYNNPTHGTFPIAGMLQEFNPTVTENSNKSVRYSLHDNFVFSKPLIGTNSIKYLSYSHGDVEIGDIPINADWKLHGQYDAQKAAQEFLANYEKQKIDDEWWKSFWATAEVSLAVLSVVPIVGQFAAAAKGTILAVRAAKYAFYTVETLLTADAFVHGSTQLIGGQAVSLGSELFKAIGQLADPVNGAKRGEQAFLVINLAMLTPLAFGSVRRIYSHVGNSRIAARFENAVLDSAQRAEIPATAPTTSNTPPNPNSIPVQGEPLAIHVDFRIHVDSSVSSYPVPYAVRTRMTPSLDTNSTFFTIVSESDAIKANLTLQARTLREQMVLLISQGTRASRIAKPLERAANAHLAKHLVDNMGLESRNILGALENASGQGLDLIIRVPPPPMMQRRVPQNGNERNSIIGAISSHRNVQEAVDFTRGGTVNAGEMIVIFEVKSTRTTKTPGFIRNTQGAGGEANTQRVLNLIDQGDGVYSARNMERATPNYLELVETLREAQLSGNIDYMHAQVFFRPDGFINTAVGGGSGIQFNNWIP